MNSRIEDLEIALIFLREGLVRTQNLQREIDAGRKVYPDIPCRIERLESAIRRIGNEVADYRADERNKVKQIEEEKQREERAARRAEIKAEREAVKEKEEKEQVSDFSEYILKCQQDCGQRIPVNFYHDDSLQRNALRVEALRDKCVRCGMKPPEQWHESAKQRGWGLWVFSGGNPSVYGACEFRDCPMLDFFIRTAPRKAWRGKRE